MDQAQSQRGFRNNAFLDPEPQAVEAPGSRPANQRTKRQRVEQSPGHTESNAVVVGGQEPEFSIDRNVAPVACAFANQRLRIVGPELQCRSALAVSPLAVADRFPFSLDSNAEADTRRVQKPLRLVF